MIGCYILDTTLLMIILPLINIIICYYYAKQKGINAVTILNKNYQILKSSY